MTAALAATDRPYQLLPPLDPEQRRLLTQSIEANGVLEPVVFDEDGEILDGHHRVEIAEELGIEYPRRVIDDLDDTGKQAYALTVNLARRQLTSAGRSAHIMRLRQLGMSVRRIAEATGIPKSTVSDDLRQLSESGQLAQPERITGADGKSRPATRPAQTPEPAAAPSFPVVGSGQAPAPVTDASRPSREPADPGATSPASDPVAAVAAALDQFVPDPDAPKRAWGRDLYARVRPVHDFLLWLKTEDVAAFADEQDITTLKHLATSFADAHRRAVEATTASVTPLRRIK